MTSSELADLLAYVYPVVWALLALGFVIMVGAYLKTRRPHTVSGAMTFLCGLAYFVAVGQLAFTRPYTVDLIQARFALAALAVSLTVHYCVAGWEEWNTQRQRKNGNGHLGRLG